MSGTPPTVNVGLIGYGFSGKTFHAPLIAAVAGLELTAVATRQADVVASDLPEVAVEPDPDALIARDDLDLIVIATPNDTHAPLARTAIAAGKHVVIDKPFALDLAEARALIVLAEQHGVTLSVFHNRRWDSDFLAVQKAIADGMVGTVRQFESHFDRFRPEVRDRWRERAGPGSGVWFDLGPHLVDQALLLFGLPEMVQVNLAVQRQDAVVDDWAHAILSYGSVRVVLQAGLLVAGGTNRFTVHGDAGSLVKAFADRQEAQLIAGVRPGATDWGLDPDTPRLFDTSGVGRPIAGMRGDQSLYYAGMRDAVNGAGTNPVRPIEALAVMAVIEAGAASSQARRAMPVPMTADEIATWHDGR